MSPIFFVLTNTSELSAKVHRHVSGNQGLENPIRFDTLYVRIIFGLLAKQSVKSREIEKATSQRRLSWGCPSSNQRARVTKTSMNLENFDNKFCPDLRKLFLGKLKFPFVAKVFSSLTIQIEADRGKN